MLACEQSSACPCERTELRLCLQEVRAPPMLVRGQSSAHACERSELRPCFREVRAPPMLVRGQSSAHACERSELRHACQRSEFRPCLRVSEIPPVLASEKSLNEDPWFRYQSLQLPPLWGVQDLEIAKARPPLGLRALLEICDRRLNLS